MISVVVPTLNEEDGIGELYARISAAAREWPDREMELIIVDDGSTDRTLAIARELARADQRLRIVSLTRNFGHQAAVSAGLNHSIGDVVIVMDADLQDPPESVGPLIEKLQDGFDVVYAIRTKRKENLVKRTLYFLYYRLLRHLATLEIPLDSGDFCVMRGNVCRAICELPERNRFVRGLRTWVGYRQVGVAYERQARFAGEAKYSFSKLVKLGLDGIVNFSYKPLHFAFLFGVTVGILSCIAGAFVLFQYATNWTVWGFNPRQARGWTSLIFTLLFSSAAQLFCMGILSEYMGRLFEESKRRPIYLVKERVNFQETKSTSDRSTDCETLESHSLSLERQ
ncbi:MAG TPA: glycosyltransferase family 2 protein [Bryobacteraceae bacterium]